MKAIDGAEYYVGQAAKITEPLNGLSTDWARSIGIKYSYSIELRDMGRYRFKLPAEFIEPTAKEAVAFIRVVARYARKNQASSI